MSDKNLEIKKEKVCKDKKCCKSGTCKIDSTEKSKTILENKDIRILHG